MYTGTVAQPTDEVNGSVRVDHNFSSRDFLFARYTIDRATSVQAQNFLSNQDFESGNQYVTVQEDHIFSPALLNTFRTGFNRSVNVIAPTQVPGGESLGFGTGLPIGRLIVAGLTDLGPNPTTALIQFQNAFQYEDDLVYTRGAHTLKFGAMLEHFQWNTDQPAFIQGSMTFRDLRNFLLAGPVGTSATALLPQSSTYRALRTNLLGFFAQDDYKLTPRLMLN